MRFRAERMRGAKRRRFELPDDDGEGLQGLTHLGRPLGEGSEEGGEGDSENEEIAEEIMNSVQFPEGPGADGKRKSRKEILAEIVAKSKMHKAARAREKEKEEENVDELDKIWQKLLNTTAFRSLLRKQRTMPEQKKGRPELDATYDNDTRMLTFGATATPADRTLTSEEVEFKGRKDLESKEQERLMRMRGEEAKAAEKLDLLQGEGGYGARRKRRKLAEIVAKEEQEAREKEGGGDDLADYEEISDESEEEELTGLEARQRARAAGDDPLQQRFREISEQVLHRYTAGVPQGTAGSDHDQQSSQSELEDLDSSSEGDDRSVDSKSEELESGEATVDGTGGVDVDVMLQKHGNGGSEMQDEDGEHGNVECESGLGDLENGRDAKDVAGTESRSIVVLESEDTGPETQEESEDTGLLEIKDSGPQGQEVVAGNGNVMVGHSSGNQGGGETMDGGRNGTGPVDLPYTLPVPKSYEEFAGWCRGRSGADLGQIISRIRTFNSVELAADGKQKLQVLYSFLSQHFAALAGATPLPGPLLDALVAPLLDLTARVPFYAASLAQARLQKIRHTVSAGLKDPRPSGRAPWPSVRSVLLLRLFSVLFPVGDRSHAVTTPLALIVNQCLGSCPVSDGRDVILGLAICAVAIAVLDPAKRFAPEPVTFLTSLIRGALPGAGGRPGSLGLRDREADHRPRGMSVEEGLARVGDAAFLESDGFRAEAMRIAIMSAGRLVEAYGGLACFPELFGEMLGVLENLGGRKSLLPQALRPMRRRLADAIRATSAQALSSRRPLVQSFRREASRMRLYNPRFEDDYAAGRDYDPDEDAVKARRLQRRVRRERRGAARELRRDAAFMAGVRDRERAEVDGERLESERRFYRELEGLEADFRSGGQAGMNPHLAKKRDRRR
ncbi:unnamed protein product [Ostreobium quekettii]|uniref:Nucleolar protein 14 n=1 Tax=Ostreobium quekettii TaxID=121088 RepID=A0A8S1JA65_9CHLO|nr:unnamed protein product [Ostreobium quekettii]